MKNTPQKCQQWLLRQLILLVLADVSNFVDIIAEVTSRC